MEYFLFSVRIALNPFVNLFQKRLSCDGISSLHLVFFGYCVSALLGSALVLFRGIGPIPPGMFADVAAMALFGTAGNVLLVLALSRCDLSIFGSINAFKPVIGLLLAFFMLGEAPSVQSLAGICVIVAGSAVLSFNPGEGLSLRSFRGLFLASGVLLRFASLALISVEAVIMRKIVAQTDPSTAFFFWAASGAPLLLIVCLLLRPGRMRSSLLSLRRSPVDAFGSVFLHSVMQYVTFVVFSHAIVGVSLALFQLSSLISVFLGRAFLGEKNFFARLAGALIMSAGAVLILLK